MTSVNFGRQVGEIIRRQRELAALPMRQVAGMVGISGPYLSQIENGLRAPSDQVLRNLAETLGIPLDDLMDESTGDDAAAEDAFKEVIKADTNLTAAQRRALLEVYSSMIAATQAQRQTKD